MILLQAHSHPISVPACPFSPHMAITKLPAYIGVTVFQSDSTPERQRCIVWYLSQQFDNVQTCPYRMTQQCTSIVSEMPQWRYTRLTQTWVMNFGGDSGASSGRAWLTGPRSSSFSFSPLIPSGNCESRTISRLAVMWTNYSKCTAINDGEHNLTQCQVLSCLSWSANRCYHVCSIGNPSALYRYVNNIYV